MKPLTEILTEEAEQRERAWRYEKAIGNLTTVKRDIARLTPRVTHYREQVAVFDKLAQQTRAIDPELVGKDGYIAREIINLHLAAARGNALRWVEKIEGQLAALTAQVPRMEALVKELEG